MALKVRPLTEQEAAALERLARSRTAPHRVVQRAQIVWASAQGAMVPAIARQVGLSAFRVRAWLRRFNRHGLAGLADAPRSGRPRRHDETARGTVIALARTKPQSLGLPFALWTLARLQQALQERHGLCVTPATIWKWLQAEGLAWKRQQSWFQVVVDAAFTEKRGPSSRPTRSRAQSGGSSASTSSGR
jgi:transposase